ncbi:MAG: hypothetical protein LUD27_01655 [Clostridia bacterium]|nr:hypothetical protein [Clostridia bacterium]
MKGKYTKTFICSFIAAGVVCLAAGLMIYFINPESSGMQMLIGITVTVVGAADTFVSLCVLLIVLIKERLSKADKQHINEIQEDKKD